MITAYQGPTGCRELCPRDVIESLALAFEMGTITVQLTEEETKPREVKLLPEASEKRRARHCVSTWG